jgi:hypothetical protein
VLVVLRCAREDLPSLVPFGGRDDEANQRDMRGSMGGFGEASIQDVARRVMPCPLPHHRPVDRRRRGRHPKWISFAEEPDYSILPPSSEFVPDDNEGRYEAWSTALNASDEWIRATAYPHPDYDEAAFFTHDLGVLRLSEPVILPEYGQLPTLGLLDELYAEDKQQRCTAVGYGLEGSGPKTSFGGDTRRRAELRLVNLNGVLSVRRLWPGRRRAR